MDHFKAIFFLEKNPRIRSLFDSFWGISKVRNPFVSLASETDFWNSTFESVDLLIIDAQMIQENPQGWIEKLERVKKFDSSRVIWVTETKETREKLISMGARNVLRLPFQWNQWLPVIRSMGLRWRLWSNEGSEK